jgi:hypothetical protein
LATSKLTRAAPTLSSMSPDFGIISPGIMMRL